MGGALFYRMSAEPAPSVRQAKLPTELVLRVLWSGKSARTSELVAKVGTLRTRDAATFRRCIDALGACVLASERACERDDVTAMIVAGQANARALADLGREADAPIVPPAFAELALLAEREAAAFYPSGAGGGDVGVWLARSAPSPSFLDLARSAGMSPLELSVDGAGLRIRKD